MARSACAGINVILTERPFEGDLGAKLYVGTSGRDSIRYRLNQCFDPLNMPLVIPDSRDVSVATVKSPTHELEYEIPPDLFGEDIWYQVRTHQSDYENETLFRPRHLETDSGGNGNDSIYGTASVVDLMKLDGGGVRISFIWRPVRDGIQPESFRVTKLTGSGTITVVNSTAAGAGRYSADVVGLTDGVAYTFKLEAINGAVTVILVTGIAFTGDSSGPPIVDSVRIVEA